MRNVEELIHQLDTTETQVEFGMRWVQLKRADATDMANLLNDFLQTGASTFSGGSGSYGSSSYGGGVYGGGGGGYSSGGGSGGTAAQQAFLLNFKQTNPQGGETIQRLLRQNIRIIPDTRTNTLIISAPNESVEALLQMINELDSISPVNVEIETFQLQQCRCHRGPDDPRTTLRRR